MTGVNEGQAGILHAIREPITIGVDRERVGSGLGVADIDATAVLDTIEEVVAVGVGILRISAEILFLGVGQGVSVGISEGPVGTVPGPGGRLANRSVVIVVQVIGSFPVPGKAVPIVVFASGCCDHQVVDDDV
ncbi:hypothetical protein CMK17_21560 [Candidatus Poribacteria bacterium]|nr:hypothetical protein [Candidatus Poribacteria bacterium]